MNCAEHGASVATGRSLSTGEGRSERQTLAFAARQRRRSTTQATRKRGVGQGSRSAKSDAGDARLLADLVRTDRHNHREVAGDSDGASMTWTRRSSRPMETLARP